MCSLDKCKNANTLMTSIEERVLSFLLDDVALDLCLEVRHALYLFINRMS